MLSVWIRAIRIKFLLASVIAVSTGLALSWWDLGVLSVQYAVITMAGVIALHISVDLFNDYWDYKRGIDTATKRTKVSGGTGVLPEGLLQPKHVYYAAIASLIVGCAFGGYAVYVGGIVIAAILGFAVLSICLYSTKIVDAGLAELFVGIKGMLIVVGTFYLQSLELGIESFFAGMVIGALSSTVLFVTSFPDHDADKSKGRKTLVILLGKKKAALAFWIFPSFAYAVIVLCVILGLFPIFALIALFLVPILVHFGLALRHNYDDAKQIEPVMYGVVNFSRITGVLFLIGFVIGSIQLS